MTPFCNFTIRGNFQESGAAMSKHREIRPGGMLMGTGHIWERDDDIIHNLDFPGDSSRFLAPFYRVTCNYLGLFLLTTHDHHIARADISN